MEYPTRVTGGSLRMFLAINVPVKRGFNLVRDMATAIEIFVMAIPEVGMGAVLDE